MLLLAGSNSALLEGLAQALARTGQRISVAHSLDEAGELRRQHAPVLTVVERALLAEAPATQPFLREALAAGGALVTFRESGGQTAQVPLAPGLERLVLADLELPLERHRLAALAEHVAARARTVGRPPTGPQPESPPS